MGETLHLLLRVGNEGAYEVVANESWSGQKKVCGQFIPPYSSRQLNSLQRKLGHLDSSDQELRTIGYRLFTALCGSSDATLLANPAPTSVQHVLQTIIQRTLRRRGTVALTLTFGPGCEEFVRYPWELLHNGQHFLLVSGIFTLSRALLRPNAPIAYQLPVHPPFRVLYIGASPSNCTPLETERSFESMEQALSSLIESGQIFLDRLEPPTFSQLVRYLHTYGGASTLDDSDNKWPCYVIHFDGHGTYGRLCPREGCETVNAPEAKQCSECATSLLKVNPQTYLCFCDDDGLNSFVNTQALRDLLLSSDVRLAVFSACETATLGREPSSSRQQRTAVDATLATALVTSQVSAVVAMPFSLQDDLSPTFMYHFYEALAEGRTLEEAISRSRLAMLPMQQRSWFIPVLYRHSSEEDDEPVPLIALNGVAETDGHPLAHLNPPGSFVGREHELQELDDLLGSAASGARTSASTGRSVSRPFYHHIALTGAAGIGKSALAFEAINRNQDKFVGRIVALSLQNGKAFNDALIEIIHQLHISVRNIHATDVKQRMRLIQGTMRSLSGRDLPCMLFLDGFEEVHRRGELETWLQFLCTLPKEVVVMVTSRFNPEHLMVIGGPDCRWYEYRVGKMLHEDLLHLFSELAFSSGLDQRIQLHDEKQQAVLHDICTLLDGSPLGAELIFGTARNIGGHIYTPEAATRSLEEIRDELRAHPLAGIKAVLQVANHHLSPSARVLLSYLAAFRLPFTSEQIELLLSPETFAAARVMIWELKDLDALVHSWRMARDELVQASFLQFDGRFYSIHQQTRNFALSYLPPDETRRVHRVIAAYYAHLPMPTANEWISAFAHLEAAADEADLREAVQVALQATQALEGKGNELLLHPILKRALAYAQRVGDPLVEAQVGIHLGIVQRQLGCVSEAEFALSKSIADLAIQDVPTEIARAKLELGILYRMTGKLHKATSCFQEALRLFSAASDIRGEGRTCSEWSLLEYNLTNYETGLQLTDKAYDCFARSADHIGRAHTTINRGTLYTATQQPLRALHDYEEAQRIFHSTQRIVDQSWVNVHKSNIYLQQGKLELAEKLLLEAITIFQERRLLRAHAWSLYLLGNLYTQRHMVSQGLQTFAESLTLAKTVDDIILQILLWLARGHLLLAQNNIEDALSSFEHASTLALSYELQHLNALALEGIDKCQDP